MAGRHRATTPSRAKPVVIGTLATTAIATSFWLASNVRGDAADRAITAATTTDPSIVLSPPTTTTTPAPSTSRTPPTTTRRTTTATTTRPRPTTTRPTTRRSPEPTTHTHSPTTTPPPPPTTTSPRPTAKPCSTTLDGTQPHVAQVGNHLLGKFDVEYVIGRAARSGTSDHPSGLAIDLFVSTPTGDALAAYVLRNKARFGMKYVIWRQRYNDGSGWSYMADRGSPTANHYDHVHVSFHDDVDVDVRC